MKKYSLGPSPIDLRDITSSSGTPLSSSTSKKRNLSQASIDDFVTPSSASKKSRPASLLSFGSEVKIPKRTPVSNKKSKSSSNKKKSPKKNVKALKLRTSSPQKPLKSPLKAARPPKSPHSSSVSKEALKLLNKAKKMKQMDLRKSIVKAITDLPLSDAEFQDMKKRGDEEKEWKEVLKEFEQQRKKTERLKRLQEVTKRRKLERLRQRELLKPREDMLCKDSKVRA